MRSARLALGLISVLDTIKYTSAERRNDPILTGPHWPVFWHYALSSVAGLLALTTANIVDGIFIRNFASADALTALLCLYFHQPLYWQLEPTQCSFH